MAGVDGGLNPRINGAGRKVGTEFAVMPPEQKGCTVGPLSTPLAARGGGRRPAFTGANRAVTMGDQGAVPDVLTVPDRTPRVYRNDYAAVYARGYAAANTHRLSAGYPRHGARQQWIRPPLEDVPRKRRRGEHAPGHAQGSRRSQGRARHHGCRYRHGSQSRLAQGTRLPLPRR